MKLSESLRRNIFNAGVGGIINRFRGKRRRVILFFEDILAEYIKECENAGYEENMRKIGEYWGVLGTKLLSDLRILANVHLLNFFAKGAWSNIGLIDDFKLLKKDGFIIIETKNEFITRTIGKNEFMEGVFGGCLASYSGKKAEIVWSRTNKETANYKYVITEERYPFQETNKGACKLPNAANDNFGFTLKDALKSHILTLKQNNRLYFRQKSVIPLENTIFHIISNENILLEKVPFISYCFFKEIISEDAPDEKRLILLKTLLQTMGWCKTKLLFNRNEIIMNLENLPSGMQRENNNWIFLINVILGYLWLIDKRYRIFRVSQKKKSLMITFRRLSG